MAIISCCILDNELSTGAVQTQVQLMRSNHMTSHTLLEEVESELSKVRNRPYLSVAWLYICAVCS